MCGSRHNVIAQSCGNSLFRICALNGTCCQHVMSSCADLFSSNDVSAPWPRPQQQWLTTGARYAGRRNSQGRRRATSLRIELREQPYAKVGEVGAAVSRKDASHALAEMTMTNAFVRIA